jgi:hypothetical protein
MEAREQSGASSVAAAGTGRDVTNCYNALTVEGSGVLREPGLYLGNPASYLGNPVSYSSNPTTYSGNPATYSPKVQAVFGAGGLCLRTSPALCWALTEVRRLGCQCTGRVRICDQLGDAAGT